MIDIRKQDLKTIKDILQKHIPDYQVRVFGSRVNGAAQVSSDIDLVIVGKKELTRRQKVNLKYAFEESRLPFRVDIADWQKISPEFKEIIERKYEIIQ